MTLSLPLVNISEVKEPDNFLCTLPEVNYNSPRFFRRDDPRRKSSGWHYPARLELDPPALPGSVDCPGIRIHREQGSPPKRLPPAKVETQNENALR